MSKSYYEILNINKDATDNEIKKSYRKLALKYHPDRNPNNREECEAKFKEISEAHSVLSDKSKRQNYDVFGKDGANNASNFSSPFENIFNNMNGFADFGNIFNPQQQQQRKPKMKEKVINVELKDLYKGKKEMFINQIKIKCGTCNGIGCKNESDIILCDLCNGQGKIKKIQRMGSMVSQTISNCYKCNGKGKTIKKESLCQTCDGNKVIIQSTHIDFYIKPGSYHGEKILLRSKGDWDIKTNDYGDLMIIINEIKDNGHLTREGENLIYNKQVSLVDALCGFEFIIKQLDNRYLKVKINDIIKTNDIRCVKGEGMKKNNELNEYGDLIINFTVIFPNELSEKRKEYLRKIIPQTEKQIWDLDPKDYPNAEIKKLDYYKEQMNENINDYEETDIPENVECATQ
jgi:DnaJ homolog subfamily A member 2